MKKGALLLLTWLLCSSYGPPNCNLYLSDSNCLEACHEAERAIRHAQGSRLSQKHFDESINRCPTFDYSYYEKSVPFAKRGLIRQWNEMMDKAMALDSLEYLPIRGWYHFFFMKNYQKAIDDIEAYDRMIDYDMGPTGDGIYHLNMIRAFCYDALGYKEKGMLIMATQIEDLDHHLGAYDYLHLGVRYLEMEEYNLGIATLERQVAHYEMAEAHYYLSLAYKKLQQNDKRSEHLTQAMELYEKGLYLRNPYIELPDRVYLSEIKRETDDL